MKIKRARKIKLERKKDQRKYIYKRIRKNTIYRKRGGKNSYCYETDGTLSSILSLLNCSENGGWPRFKKPFNPMIWTLVFLLCHSLG
jgi:hypothetical protein